ncbi:hypothetical protein GW626_04440 [Peribacillus muralis]|uniref:hypothetical protein n=1 Tax=Peribacillus muralis TaxID=264697 RepID=UPI001F4E3725|nr:hypothetical protein [Peribacillus muralis]MCK1993123.1 hypothetical protein [Peribacillus muralis]MCK2013678.1 hypothetical protein [Peribacillus muralis]
MNTLDAKVIETRYGLEMYSDLIENIEVKEILSPTTDNRFYEIILGIKYFLLAEKKYYTNQKHYFGFRMSDDYNLIMLIEPETESLFAVKNEIERQATKELIANWLTKTEAFKQVVNEMIEKQKGREVQTEQDIEEVLGIIKFLEKLPLVKPEDIEQASIEKGINAEFIF